MELNVTGQELEDVRRFGDFTEKMEAQDQMDMDWSRYFCNQRPVELDASANQHPLCSELKSSCGRVEDKSEAYCNIWTDVEPTRVKSCSSRSFAMDARIRLDSLKSGCNSPLMYCAPARTMYNYNCEEDLWDSEESQDKQSALDSVQILDIEDDEQDEESWLYESPKKQSFLENQDSALRWCRHVLDNPSPEMEAACRVLINRLDQRSRRHFYRQPVVFHQASSTSEDKTCFTSDILDHNGLNNPSDSITTGYRLQDITDVHIMARIQEASLRQDYVSAPSSAPPRRNTESPVTTSSCFNTTADNCDSGNKTKASSSCQQPGLQSFSPTSVTKQGCQSPKLARLHQQVTQFKLLKLAQNQASPGRTRSPLRTSLRSLQAVRNSRSLETDDDQPDDQITSTSSGVSSPRGGSSYWTTSPSPATQISSSLLQSMKDLSTRTAAVKRLHRSQSLSPRRIPHPAKAYMSVHGRVFASPERQTAVAWARNVASIQR